MNGQFVDNKYSRCYARLIERARCRVVSSGSLFEWHHVLPKSLGGAKLERVALSFKEHFFAHLLLTKFTHGEAHRKMNFALASMARSNGKTRGLPTSRQFDIARRAWRDALLGRRRNPFSQSTREKMSESAKRRATPGQMSRVASHLRGFKHTTEVRANMSAAKSGEKNPMYGKAVSEETRAKRRAAQQGKTHSEETKAKMRAAHARRRTELLWTDSSKPSQP